MLITIAAVLDGEALARHRATLDSLTWRDGRRTAGARARRVKRNEQADLAVGAGRALHDALREAVLTHPVVRAAARPRRCSRLLVSRTAESGGYGPHVDNALMGRGAQRLRADLAFTLALSEPGSYTGGELVLHLAGAVQEFRPAAGDLLLYPATTIHEVRPVTTGTRAVAVGWLESEVHDAGAREVLFDLENLRAELGRSLPPESAELLTLDKAIANLLRLHARP